MWWLFAILSAVFAALTAIFAKFGLKGIDSDLATAIRTVIILVMAWSIVSFKGTPLHLSSLSRSNWLFLILSGLATGASWIFYFKALQLGEVSKVVAIDKSSLAITLILSFIFLGEVLSLKMAFGIVLIIAGTFLVIL